MGIRYKTPAAILAGLWLLFGVINAVGEETKASPVVPAFPSLLEVLWTRAELRGRLDDRQIRKGIITPCDTMPKTNPARVHPPLPPRLRQSIREVRPAGDRRLVALTFDLCEGPGEKAGYDAEIVNYLRDQGIRATFFPTGKWMCSHPDKTMQLMADPLFEVGSHSWDHRNFRFLTVPEMERQILATQVQYELLWEELVSRLAAAGVEPARLARIPPAIRVFRFPYGACRTEALNLLARLGLPAIQWSVVSGDPAPGQSAALISSRILKEVRPGAIIICHANGRGHHTAAALPRIIPALKSQGYSFVTVSELLAAGEVVSSPECYEIKPGDGAKYDRYFRR